MDKLHAVLRSIRGETKARRDHLEIFREFLTNIDRATRRKPMRMHRTAKGASRRARK